MNSFIWKNGILYHFVNDEPRAAVPAASLDDYRETCPDAPDEPAAPKKGK